MMAGNLGKEDPSSVQDFQDPSITGSGHKRRRGSVQPSSSRAGKKSKSEIDRDYRERKKEATDKLKAEMNKLKESKIHLDGQVFELRKDLKETREEMKETREENTKLKIVQKSQSESILEMGKKLIALGEHHQKEIQALKEQHAQERLLCWCSSIDMDILRTPVMNNPMETVPATAQATTNF